MDKPYARGLVWFRRDLRVADHAALHHALRACREVWCAFVFDRDILAPLPAEDRRLSFIHASVRELDAELRALHPLGEGGLQVRHGAAVPEISALAQALGVQAVFTNHDYEPQAKARDAQALGRLAEHGIVLHSHKDQVIFEGDELLTQGGRPYGVYTPYKNAWLRKVNAFYLSSYPVRSHAQALAPWPQALQRPCPTLAELGFAEQPLKIAAGARAGQALYEDFLHRIDAYEAQRNFPAVKGPSYLSVHLRFGTVSIRRLASAAHRLAGAGNHGAAVWLSELIWRDFYFQILHHHPQVVQHSFKPDYDRIRWHHGAHADALYSAWCEARTGYPLVDAAMAQLNQTGYMHNRLRMVVASFLCKDLGLDWRRGEAWFARQLLDFDLAANNGGWQWASSSGCDAQPWFRIFNPVSQSEKFDPQGKFIRRYLPQLAGLPDRAIHAPWLAAPLELAAAGVRLGENYPEPVVMHDEARAATLQRYAVVKKA